MKPLLTTILILLLITNRCFSQDSTMRYSKDKVLEEKAIRLLVGGDLQFAHIDTQKEFTRKYVEIGILYQDRTDGHISEGSFTQGLSVEISLAGKNIYGFKYSAWLEAGLVIFGLSTIYYTDFDHGNFKIRPELGIGAYPVKMSAGINIPTIHNADFKGAAKIAFPGYAKHFAEVENAETGRTLTARFRGQK